MNVNLLNFRKLITENKIIFNFVLFICMNFFINSSNQFDYNFSCVVFGVTEAGKNNVINVLVGKKYTDKYTKLLGINFSTKWYEIDSKIVKLNFWILSGEEKFYNINETFMKNRHIAIIILPLDKDGLLDSLKKYVKDIKENSSICKCIIVLNKVDLNTKSEEEIENLKTNCGKILNTNNLEGGVISFSAKYGNGINELNKEIEKMLQELIKEKEPLKRGKELLKKDDSDTGNDSHDDSSQVIKPIPNVLDITDHAKKKSKQKKPITNTKKSDSNDNGNEYTNQKQNCISCRAK